MHELFQILLYLSSRSQKAKNKKGEKKKETNRKKAGVKFMVGQMGVAISHFPNFVFTLAHLSENSLLS